MTPNTNVLSPQEQAAFLESAENVRHAAESHLRRQDSERSAITFVRSVQHAVDRVLGAAIAQGARIDCKAGCSHCCNARVEAIPPEIFLIASEIEQRSPSERADIVARLQTHITASNLEAAPWNHRTSCPFLKDHLCSIYHVRPAACRKAHSVDVDACASHASVIPQNLKIVLDSEALLKGTSEAYRQCGVGASGHELVRAVLLALLDPSAQARWYNGEQVFESATTEPSKLIRDVV